MTYFLKANKEEPISTLPGILLLTIYKNLFHLNGDLSGLYLTQTNKNNFISYEIPLSTYLACWRLSLLLVSDLIDEKLSYEREEIKTTHRFSSDLGSDSIDLVEIALYLEKVTKIQISEKINFKTVSDLTDYIFLILVSRVKKKLFLLEYSDKKMSDLL
jgi:acyl carrier protein